MEPNNEEDGSKKITFSGINTKYQMKKVSGMRSTVPKAKVNWDETNPTDKQSQMLLLDTNPPKEIMLKLSGYRNQDILKNRFDELTFITFQQTVHLLVVSELTCFYCKCFTPVLYKNVRDGNQWSLDRIDNNLGHAHNNVIISCLKCNLQRKRMSSNTFAMSKQFILTRIDLDPNMELNPNTTLDPNETFDYVS